MLNASYIIVFSELKNRLFIILITILISLSFFFIFDLKITNIMLAYNYYVQHFNNKIGLNNNFFLYFGGDINNINHSLVFYYPEIEYTSRFYILYNYLNLWGIFLLSVFVLPSVLYNFYLFFIPSLYKYEIKKLSKLIALSQICVVLLFFIIPLFEGYIISFYNQSFNYDMKGTLYLNYDLLDIIYYKCIIASTILLVLLIYITIFYLSHYKSLDSFIFTIYKVRKITMVIFLLFTFLLPIQFVVILLLALLIAIELRVFYLVYVAL